MQIDAVVFDIGNVLIEWNPERFYDRVIGEDRRRAMFAQVDLHGMNDRVDTGHDFKATIYEMADATPDWTAEIRMWHDNWIELASPAIPHSVKLLRALRQESVPVFALSNFGIQSFAYAQTQYAFLDEFDQPYISGHLGVIKPDAKIYEILEDRSQVAPERLLFTDDRADNIAAAAARGWQTHLFEGPSGFAQRLVDAGLLSADQARA